MPKRRDWKSYGGAMTFDDAVSAMLTMLGEHLRTERMEDGPNPVVHQSHSFNRQILTTAGAIKGPNGHEFMVRVLMYPEKYDDVMFDLIMKDQVGGS